MRTAPGTGPVKLRGLKIGFLSAVDRPAHEGATALLLKRRGEPTPSQTTKRLAFKLALKSHPHADQIAKHGGEMPVVMTSSEVGHSHLIYLSARAGSSSYQRSADSEGGHDHPWMLSQDESGTFTITIGDSEGHTHTVDGRALNAAFAAAALSKLFDDDSAPEDVMTQPQPQPTKKTEAEIAALETRLALSQLFGALNDAERTHLNSLATEADKRAFIVQAPDARKAAIAKVAADATSNSEVLYTDLDGHTYTKRDDPRQIAAAKRADDASKRASAAEGKLAQNELEKRADVELKNLPGTTKTRATLLKMVESIKDPVERDDALKSLKAGDAAIGLGFNTLGTTAASDALQMDDASPEGKLNALAARHQATKGVSFAKAYAEVTEMPEGAALYKQITHTGRTPAN